jgi:hypothetical protein
MSVPLPKLWALSSLSVAGVSKLFLHASHI